MTRKQLKDLISRAAWTAFQAFAGSVIVLLPGILSAPNLNNAKALAVSAIVAGISAGISALKTYIKATL